ncbi:MAG: ATPase, T2SS/T4P/T4SS family [Acidobacteria bacterium]|nr:ATPase, T2SS/T4P/T4SS family [Acidobacteriota bacterium]
MSKQLETLLRQSDLLTEAQLIRDLEQARKQNMSLIDVVLQEERLTEEQLADLFAAATKIPRIRVAASAVDPVAIENVPDKLARRYCCLPLSVEGRVLTLALADPGDYLAIQDIEFASGLSVRPVIATRTEILDGIEERYAAEDRIGSFLANVPDVTDLHIGADDPTEDLAVSVVDSRSAADVAPVVKMCNLIVHDAIKAGASDSHIEPTMHDVNVRMRVDGVLRDYTHVPKWLHSPLVSRLKILAKLDISERRLPQDGRINVQYQGRTIDIRVSTLPTHFGEKAVLRYLGGGVLPKVDRMGLNATQSTLLEDVIRQPQGMILVTGPTGSGKTTTLYALLARRRSTEVNIVTVEDPIEYHLPGINQVQINPKAGLSFANALRSILRQDPDVILVGETRDQETAEVAFQSAMTGHLVLSTLHTNSAVAAIPRLYDLGVEPSILATSLTLVIAQRLVRRICDGCKEPYMPDAETSLKVGLSSIDGMVYRGKGCASCGGTGFAGRVGIYEFFRPTTAVRKMIGARASESDLRAAARQGGMKLLREDALDKVKQGITSPDEVLRVVQIDQTESPCAYCGALIEIDFSTCPYCLSNLKKTCASCGQDLKIEWKACPYCNSKAAPLELGEVTVALTSAASSDGRVAQRPVTPGRAAAGAPSVSSADPMSWPGVRTFDFDIGDATLPDQTAAARPEARVSSPSDAHRVSAPTAAARDRTPAAEVAARAPSEASEPEARRLRVLVVDDDEDIRQVVAFTLKSLAVPVDVAQAVDGQEAVELATVQPPDLVVLDVMMPRLDGFETCTKLRQSVRTAFIPILMLTASADEMSRSKGYLVGTDDYMSKPFQPADLKQRVTTLLRRSYGI